MVCYTIKKQLVWLVGKGGVKMIIMRKRENIKYEIYKTKHGGLSS